MKRGFSLMSPARRKEVARKGGLTAKAKGSAHKWSSADAAVAGARGGASTVAKYGCHHMSEIGKKGGSSKKQ